ncbi:MAG: hypothetical protein NT154_32635 [Verrucomicrobia bacterium]|nr:hypothetical protein [Verrucomicrobiota bacterium]
MSVEPSTHCAADLEYLQDLLRREAKRAEQPYRQAAAFMLDHFHSEQEFPSVRAIAEAIHTSPSCAHRYSKAILSVWRRTLTAFGLCP